MTAPTTNRAFLAKAIHRAQRLSIDQPFCLALHEFIVRNTAIVWDDCRALFWVEHPDQGWQVAGWLMPIALHFEPQP